MDRWAGCHGRCAPARTVQPCERAPCRSRAVGRLGVELGDPALEGVMLGGRGHLQLTSQCALALVEIVLGRPLSPPPQVQREDPAADRDAQPPLHGVQLRGREIFRVESGPAHPHPQHRHPRSQSPRRCPARPAPPPRQVFGAPARRSAAPPHRAGMPAPAPTQGHGRWCLAHDLSSSRIPPGYTPTTRSRAGLARQANVNGRDQLMSTVLGLPYPRLGRLVDP